MRSLRLRRFLFCLLGVRARKPDAAGFRSLRIVPQTRRSLLAQLRFRAELLQRIRRGVFRSIVDLQSAIKRYLEEYNADPRPFVWTKSADTNLRKLSAVPVSFV